MDTPPSFSHNFNQNFEIFLSDWPSTQNWIDCCAPIHCRKLMFKVDFSLEMISPHCTVDGMENSARGWTWGALYWRLRLLSIRSFVRLPRRWQLCYKRWQQSTNKACKQCTSSFLYSIDTFAASLTSYQYFYISQPPEYHA